MNKLKEDLTKELQDKFNRDTEVERERLREEFEARYSQTIQDLKAKADEFEAKAYEFEAKNSELGVLLDKSKTENNNLKEQIDEHKLENEGLIQQIYLSFLFNLLNLYYALFFNPKYPTN